MIEADSKILLDALTQKRRNIPRALRYSHNLDEIFLSAIEYQVSANGPEENRIQGQVISLMPYARASRQRVEGVKELSDPAIRCANVVKGDILPYLVLVQRCAGAENVLFHALSFLRSRDFCSSRCRAASGFTYSPRSKEVSLAPISWLKAAS